jgi:hypothetical protein
MVRNIELVKTSSKQRNNFVKHEKNIPLVCVSPTYNMVPLPYNAISAAPKATSPPSTSPSMRAPITRCAEDDDPDDAADEDEADAADVADAMTPEAAEAAVCVLV